MPKRRNNGRRMPDHRNAQKAFGLVPIPRFTSPFSSARNQSTLAIWIPVVPNPIIVTGTSYGNSLNLTAASIAQFSAYAAVWEEYVVRAVKYTIQPCGTQNGVFKYYIDESDNSAPTSSTAQYHVGPLVPCRGYTADRVILRWTAKDTGDLQFRSTSTTSAFITALKIYSDAANYGLVGTNETVAVVDTWACVQFRTQGGK